MIRIGVIGYGYWGPNIVRNLRTLDGCRVAGVCDHDPAALERLTQAYPHLPVTAEPSEKSSSIWLPGGLTSKCVAPSCPQHCFTCAQAFCAGLS